MDICFCKIGLLSQCVASNEHEQRQCDFWKRSSASNSCMHRDDNMANRCGSLPAYDFAKENGLCRPSDEIELAFADVEEGWKAKDVLFACLDCANYKCMKLVQLASSTNGGLTYKNLEDTAMSCEHFLNKEEEITLW